MSQLRDTRKPGLDPKIAANPLILLWDSDLLSGTSFKSTLSGLVYIFSENTEQTEDMVVVQNFVVLVVICSRPSKGRDMRNEFTEHITEQLLYMNNNLYSDWTGKCLCTYLHDLAILAAVQRVQLIGFIVVWRDGCMKWGSLQFAFPLVKGFDVPGLSAAEGVRQRWLKHQQHLRLVIIPSRTSLTVTKEGESTTHCLLLFTT